MDTSKRESRFAANFPYLIMAVLPLPLLYFWFDDRNIRSLNIYLEPFTIEKGMDIAFIWVSVLMVWKAVKNYLTK